MDLDVRRWVDGHEVPAHKGARVCTRGDEVGPGNRVMMDGVSTRWKKDEEDYEEGGVIDG